MDKKKALLLFDGEVIVRRLVLEERRYVIGRADTADLMLNSKEVSRQHAQLRFKNGQYVVKDLNSTNGTYVNGKRISECILKAGDEIGVGNFSIFFDDGSGMFPYYDETKIGTRGEETAVFEDRFSLLSKRIRDKKLRSDFKRFQSAVRKSRKRLSLLAHRDRLTGLYNRQYFDKIYEKTFSATDINGGLLSILFIDIDHFKLINDKYGHQMGDEVLRFVASAISLSCRKDDVVARWGGEEIIVILPKTTSSDACKVAEEIRAAIGKKTKKLLGLMVTVSIGVANCPEDSTEPKLLIEDADKALYEAKRRGRDRVIKYHG